MSMAMQSLMVLWGLPGTGKSTFGRWLVGNKGFTNVDNDLVAVNQAPRTDLTNAWDQSWMGSPPLNPTPFMTAVARHGHPVVLQCGLSAKPHNIDLVRQIQYLDGDTWWFDGDRALALAAWLKESQRLRRPNTTDDWHHAVRMIDGNWTALEAFFGQGRILRVLEAGHRRCSGAEIYAMMETRRSKE